MLEPPLLPTVTNSKAANTVDVTVTNSALSLFVSPQVEVYLCKMREMNAQGLLSWRKHTDQERHIAESEAMGTFYASAMETLFGRPIWGPYDHQMKLFGHPAGRCGEGCASFAGAVRDSISRVPSMLTYRNEWCNSVLWNQTEFDVASLQADDSSRFGYSPHVSCKWIQKRQLWSAISARQWDGGDGG